MNETIRQEQAGFRTGRGTTRQISALRNILEQCKEWQAPVYIIFVDFSKTFDCIINIMGQYGLYQEFIIRTQAVLQKVEDI